MVELAFKDCKTTGEEIYKMNEMMERLLFAYFTESKNLGDYETLIQLAGEIGIDTEEASRVLNEGMYSDDVRHDQNTAAQIGVKGVPFFVFNEKYAVSGAQPSEMFLEVLNKVWSEQQRNVPIEIVKEEKENAKKKAEFCTGDSCQI